MNDFGQLESSLRLIEEAGTIDALKAALTRSIQTMGFDHYACSLIDSAANPRLPFLMTTYPDEWRSHYDRCGLRTHDPVFLHALRSAEPALWDDVHQLYGIPTASRLVFGPSAEFGLVHGGGLGAYGPGGQLANLQVAGRGSAIEFKHLFERQRHGLYLLANQAHLGVLRLAGHDQAVTVTLSPRQRDVLLWAMHGKTTWEIARILCIAEDTIRQHMRAAMKALGASNRTHAVALALIYKLISP